MFCKYCGKEIASDSVFCNYCGKSLGVKSNLISIRIAVERHPGIFNLTVPSDVSILNLKMLIASKCAGDVDGMGSKIILDDKREELSENYSNLSEVDFDKEKDVFIFIPKYIERTVIRRGGFSDMRCLYGCPMSRESLYEAENYSLEDSVVE